MTKIIFMMMLFISNNSLAGGGHFHPKKVAVCKVEKQCSKEEIKASVGKGIKALMNYGRIDRKYEGATVTKVEKKTFKKKGKVLNTWVADISRKTSEGWDLQFVFFTEDGKVFRANDTGELR